MMFTVKELLETEEFREFKVLAGAQGLNRKVSSVTVMDAPDIYQWLRGGEILMTTGYLWRNDISFLEELIRKIDEVHAAALFIKLGRFVNALPQAVYELAEALQFPIIHMPMQCAFTDVINPVLSKLVLEQTKIIEYSNQIHQTFIDLTIEGKGISEIVEKVSELLETDVVYIDMLGLLQQQAVMDEVMMQDEAYTKFPIQYNRKIYGYIVCQAREETLNEYHHIILEHAATIIKLQIQQKISNMEIEARYRDQFVRDIIYNNIKSKEELEYRGKNYHWFFEGRYRVIIFDIDQLKSQYSQDNKDEINEKAARVLAYAIHYFEQTISSAMYSCFSDHAVLVVHENDIVRKDSYHAMLEKVTAATKRQMGDTISIILGNEKNNILKVHKSYQEAMYVKRLIEHRTSRGMIVWYEDMGLYRLMDMMKDDMVMKRHSYDLLDKLEQYDDENHGEYKHTMDMLVVHNWNIKETAESMYMHYNTVKNRYHKLEEILGMDFERMQDRVLVELAVRYEKTQDDVFEV